MRRPWSQLALIVISSSLLGTQGGSQKNDMNVEERSSTLVFKPSATYTKPIPKIPPLPLPDGKLLITVGHMVYMIAQDGKVIWSFASEDVLTAQPAFRADRNQIATIDSVSQFYELDASTGKVLLNVGVNGGADFSDVKPFGNGFVVLEDMTDYRQKFKDLKLSDRLQYWGQTEEDNWSVPFPIGARLVVAGNHIYAIEYAKDAVKLDEIHPTSSVKR